jgi:hypothetical protein
MDWKIQWNCFYIDFYVRCVLTTVHNVNIVGKLFVHTV